MADKLIIARSIEEALQARCPGAAFLAGGTEINRLGSFVAADTLISLKKIGKLRGIKKDGGKVWIGACTTFQEIVDCPEVPEWLRDACRLMASRTKRNMATLGGNIAILRDDSYVAPALIAARATVVYTEESGKNKECCICKYMEARQEGKLGNGLILRIGIDPNRKVLLKRYANTAMSHSVMNLAYGFDPDGKAVSIGAALKNTGLFKLRSAEELIASDPDVSEERIMEWARKFDAEIPTDMFGSEEYKRYLLGTTIAKFIADARKEVLA